MSEQPTTNKNLDEKLDTVIEKVTRMEEQLKNLPRMEEQKEKNIIDRFNNYERRINNLENNQRWVILAVLGTIVNAVMQLIIH